MQSCFLSFQQIKPILLLASIVASVGLFVCLFLYNNIVVDYIKCELIGGVSARHLDTFSSLCIVAVHYPYRHVLCILAIVDYIGMCYVFLLLLTISARAMYSCYC